MAPIYPPINPKYIPLLFEIVEKTWKWLKGVLKKTGKETGETEPITNESKIEDIAKINEIFSSFKESIEQQAIEIESNVMLEISEYSDELCFVVESGNVLFSKYSMNLNGFKRRIDKLKNGIKGTMQKEISKKISLDNLECKRVIKMLPGIKKEEEFKVLLIAAINDGVEAINEKVELIIADIIDDFEFTLNDCIELIEREANSQITLLKDTEMKSNDIVQIKEIIKINANMILCSCELIETIVEEVM